MCMPALRVQTYMCRANCIHTNVNCAALGGLLLQVMDAIMRLKVHCICHPYCWAAEGDGEPTGCGAVPWGCGLVRGAGSAGRAAAVGRLFPPVGGEPVRRPLE